ncbi:S8 family serine peptidase [Staphylococcus capitis]|uniref:Protease n=1 Tax=Staphylococcus epidermidis TaxID=1282 RepID=O54221_STAEP|nr:S8 family serine peptidase [Staphylococcus capitis]MDS4025295.1 S8 family serine peptidase [Staphylococcus capitis]CAA74349.1 protease [Staphylococcus epidermidis]
MTNSDYINYTYDDRDFFEKILFIDSGCDYNHSELKNNIDLKNCKSFVDNNLNDYTGHGTQIISVLTGKIYLRGLIPNASIVVYKVTDYRGKTSIEKIYKALSQGVKKGFKVINVSFSGAIDSIFYTKKFQEIIDEARIKNIIICWSPMNNDNRLNNHKNNTNLIPNDFKNLFQIGSINRLNQISNLVCNENEIDFFAPGGDLVSETIPIEESFILLANTQLLCKLSDYYIGIPKGYTINMGNSIATSYASGCFMIIISKFKRKYKYYPSINEVLKLISKYSNSEINLIKITRSVVENALI